MGSFDPFLYALLSRLPKCRHVEEVVTETIYGAMFLRFVASFLPRTRVLAGAEISPVKRALVLGIGRVCLTPSFSCKGKVCNCLMRNSIRVRVQLRRNSLHIESVL